LLFSFFLLFFHIIYSICCIPIFFSFIFPLVKLPLLFSSYYSSFLLPPRHCILPPVIASFPPSLHPSRRHCESPNRHCILPAVIARYEAIYTTTSSHRHCEVRSNLYYYQLPPSLRGTKQSIRTTILWRRSLRASRGRQRLSNTDNN